MLGRAESLVLVGRRAPEGLVRDLVGPVGSQPHSLALLWQMLCDVCRMVRSSGRALVVFIIKQFARPFKFRSQGKSGYEGSLLNPCAWHKSGHSSSDDRALHYPDSVGA